MKNIEFAFRTHMESNDTGEGNSFKYGDNLFLVTEGIGGSYPGEIAKELAYRITYEAFFRHLSESHSPGDALIYALEKANKSILKERGKLGEKMAASVSVVYIADDIMYFTHLGDSRIYSLQGGELNQLTRDHTIQEEEPFVEAEYGDPRVMKALTNGLGIHEKPDIKIRKYPLDSKGLIFMTTEGLTRKISDREILNLSLKLKNPARLCKGLIDLANKKGGNDNKTIGILQFGGLSKGARNIVITYSVFFTLILIFAGGYALKYSGGRSSLDGIEVPESVIEPQASKAAPEPEIVKRSIRVKKVVRDEALLKENARKKKDEAFLKEKEKKKRDAELFNKIYALINDWKTAWENTAGKRGKMDRYMSFYSEKFISNRLDKKKWRRDKARKAGKKRWIRVELTDIKISGSAEENQMEVRFMQDYRSSNFSVKSTKVLLLRKEGAEWNIIAEKSH